MSTTTQMPQPVTTDPKTDADQLFTDLVYSFGTASKLTASGYDGSIEAMSLTRTSPCDCSSCASIVPTSCGQTYGAAALCPYC